MASKAYILSNLWNTMYREAAWDEPCVFNRTIAGPVDRYSVFDSLSSAEDYSQNNGIAYPGQIITVVDNSTSAVSTYKIEVGGNLTQIDTALPDVGNGLSVSTEGAIEIAAADGLSVSTEGHVAVATGEHMTVDEQGCLTLCDLCLDGGDCEGTVA
jgi:hypothetical protein